MTGNYLTKEPIDFDELKKERKSCCIEKEINDEWLVEHPNSSKSLGIVAEMVKRITEIDALLAIEPPGPELPPRGPLIKVRGILDEIETLYARGFFTDREYEPEEFSRKERSNQWGSVLLAAIGESAAAAVNSQESIRPVREYDFVKGKINGKPFHGWLGSVVAKAGDFIECVAIDKNDHYEVYALSIPEFRVISMFPECYQGIKSRGKSEVKLVFALYCIVIFSILIPSLFMGFDIIDALPRLPSLMGPNAIMFILFGMWIYYRALTKPRPTVRLAERIFTVMEFPEPTRINLVKKTKRVIKEKHAIKDENRRMPDKNCLANYLYYY